MHKFFWIVLLAFSSLASEGYKTTSVIIPCHYKHFHHLYNILKLYEQQTVLPDEIVISLSESNYIDPALIVSLQKEPWRFRVKLFCSESKLFAGQNRNIACANATGEIIICQDADDLPHPQRIEVIQYFFDKFNLDFMLHKFVYNAPDQIAQMKTLSEMDSINYAYFHTYHDAWIIGYMLFGQPAFRRKIFDKIKWRDIPIDEDNTFVVEVLRDYKKCMMIHCPLYIYRLECCVTPYDLYRGT